MLQQDTDWTLWWNLTILKLRHWKLKYSKNILWLWSWFMGSHFHLVKTNVFYLLYFDLYILCIVLPLTPHRSCVNGEPSEDWDWKEDVEWPGQCRVQWLGESWYSLASPTPLDTAAGGCRLFSVWWHGMDHPLKQTLNLSIFGARVSIFTSKSAAEEWREDIPWGISTSYVRYRNMDWKDDRYIYLSSSSSISSICTNETAGESNPGTS